MRILIQRVSRAQVWVEDKVVGKINQGLLIFLGIEAKDDQTDILWLTKKASQLRVFKDEAGLMNKSVVDTGGSFLVVSQFTLHASTQKGNRPSFIKAARPEQAEILYENFCSTLAQSSGLKVEKGLFGADMNVEILNQGPVTIWMDSKNRE